MSTHCTDDARWAETVALSAVVLLPIVKSDWFSQQKQNRIDDHSFRSDQLCLLLLACYITTDIHENLLLYKQKKCHSRWITTANGYLRELIFDCENSTGDQKEKLKKIA